MPSLASPPRFVTLPRRCEQCLQFFARANTDPRNRTLLTEYLFNTFAPSPETLYAFLLFLKQELHATPRTKQTKHIATHYLRTLSPLCERFGIFEEKNVLDALCFKITEPQHYRGVESVLSRYRRTSAKVIAEVTAILQRLLESAGHACTIEGREKHLYSIYRKIQRKRSTSPLALQDIFAFRIILHGNATEECFAVLNLLHDHFEPVVSDFKDYITIPKINGYQSIHTILNRVIPDLDLPIEVQIRTQAMHEFAEKGLASHWLYARDKHTELLSEKDQKLVAHFLFLSEAAARERTIYCLSPAGDLVKLPDGSTVIDFAYQIHTEIGNHARAARVNGSPQEISYRIREGDIVEVLTAKKKQVRDAWLQFAVTSSTRRKIHEHA